MLRISILEEDIPTIQRDRFYHPQPHIMKRMHAEELKTLKTLKFPW